MFRKKFFVIIQTGCAALYAAGVAFPDFLYKLLVLLPISPLQLHRALQRLYFWVIL